MKIILLEDVSGLGDIYDVKNVSDGYARNYLIPKGLARVADLKLIKEAEAKKILRKKQEEEFVAKLKSRAQVLAEQEFVFNLKKGKKGEIFDSISADDIKKEIAKKFPDLDSDGLKVDLAKPIRKKGVSEVEVNLSRGVKTKINLQVR